MPTYQEIADAARQAQLDILAGAQETTIDTGQGARTFKRADLDKIRALEQYATRQAKRANGLPVRYGVPAGRQ